MAAGMINTKAIQLQFLLNHSSLNVKLRTSTNTIDNNPHGNKRKVEGLEDEAGIKKWFVKKGKLEKIYEMKNEDKVNNLFMP